MRVDNMKKAKKKTDKKKTEKDLKDTQCPDCGYYALFMEGRCVLCLNCGWSKCSI